MSAAIEYKLPVTENTGVAAVSVEGSQFLPLASWYPTPNSPFSPRGTDTAPVLLKVNAPGGETVISSGQMSANGTFEQKLFAQPFFLTGKWETIEGAGDTRGVSAYLLNGATLGEKKRAEELIALAAAARAFYAGQLGTAPDAPIRLVVVRRGAGFDMNGTVLLDAAVFRRQKIDAVTALLVAESVARIWIGGQVPVRGEGAGVVREGLPRFLATQFLEKQFGREAAEAERLRQRIAYVAVARRDAPLAQTTPLEPTYFLSVANKGAMVWRLAERALGREAFAGVLRGELQGTGENRELSLAGLRAALARLGGESFKRVLDAQLDQPTETDLLVGQPRQQGAEWVAALRNNGSFEVAVSIAALTDAGERIVIERVIPPRDFAEAQFKTTARLTSAEIDPDKLYPQLDYANDAAPHSPAPEEALDEATRALAAQEFARAEDVSRKALRRAPLMQELRTLLGRALLEQNKLDEAERELRLALDKPLPLPSTMAWASIGLGEVAVRRNQFAEAAKFFQEAVASDGGYAPTLQARASRLKAEASSKVSSAPDETVRTFFNQFDAAIKGGRKADLDALILPGELLNFAKGIVGSQPELWQTRVLRTEVLGADRLAADVSVSARVLGREQSGTAVLILARSGGGLKLAEIPIFEVR
ncbi:MAG: hypothetical protein H0T45_14815 [Pyrinomonadaceae bacterium]|nr:hypothetical protein [Pyrinomonadaceae bacterium]